MSKWKQTTYFVQEQLSPNLPENYLDTVWQKLAKRLNSCNSGAVLEWNVWKILCSQRFNNWKNSTRAKYRAKVIDIKKAGGGLTLDIKLNPLEERSLNVWRRVTLTGCTKIPICGGLPTFTVLAFCSEENDNNNNSKQELVNDVIIEETVHERLDEKILETPESEDEENGESILDTGPINFVNRILLKRKKIRNSNLNTNIKRLKVAESRTIKAIGEELLNIYKKRNAMDNKENFEKKIIT
ncbi:hypothetical protein ABEB36_008197 [Hypothenemus hampei]|uniref:Uncharacterized protein n=1 Tax=Hypothenemus hampei TaxID=57062 RepID=A0ABD1EL31_HYPHA